MKYNKVEVMNFHGLGIPPQFFFWASDESRVIFFKEIKLSTLPSMNTDEDVHPMIILSRNQDTIDIGSCEWVTEQDLGLVFVLHGLEKTLWDARQYDKQAYDPHVLKPDWFENGDTIEITKTDWGKTSWLSQIATPRIYGAKFSEVFPKNSSHYKMLPESLIQAYSKVKNKTIIFDGQQPIIRELKKFF